MSVNKVILVGNVGKDPEVRYLEGGTAVCNFTLATSESYKNKNGEKITNTEWHNIVLWRGLAEIAEKYVKKGSQLYIDGRIRSRSYTDKEGNTRYVTEIVGDVMQMLGRKSDNNSTQGSRDYSKSQQSNQQSSQPTSSNAQTEDKIESASNNSDKVNDQISGDSSEVDDLPF